MLSLKGRSLGPNEQRATGNLKSKMVALFQEVLAWEKLEPKYIRLYQDSFTDEEVAGMPSFYKTPAGQAVVHKMPTLMQKAMGEAQVTLRGLTPKTEKIQQDFLAEIKTSSPATR